MARPLRVEFADAVYHAMSRGIEGRRICADDLDRDLWLEVLGRVAERFGWRVLAFCLLDNHFHLFLRTPAGGLAAGMRQMNGNYAGYFNRRHRRRGPLMQGRYKAVLVEDQSHWLELSRYVHLNPVRAGLCRRPEDWKWSSYRGYHRPAVRPKWLDCAGVLEEFGRDEGKARRAYREFVAEGLGRKLDNPVSRAVHGLVLGSDAFVKKVRKLKAERSLWRPGRRADDPARAICAYVVRKVSGARVQDLAAALGYRSQSAVSVACRRAEAAMRSGQVRRQVGELVSHAATNH